MIDDFWVGVRAEKMHQLARWGTTDRNKSPADWYWLVGYLAGKALMFAAKGDTKKALHHCISSAAVLANWHDTLGGGDPSLKVEHDPSRASDLEKVTRTVRAKGLPLWWAIRQLQEGRAVVDADGDTWWPSDDEHPNRGLFSLLQSAGADGFDDTDNYAQSWTLAVQP